MSTRGRSSPTCAAHGSCIPRGAAVANAEILHDNDIAIGCRAPTPYHDDEPTAQFDECLARNLSSAEVERLREITGVAAPTPIPRLEGTEVTAAVPKERYPVESLFVVDVESRCTASKVA